MRVTALRVATSMYMLVNRSVIVTPRLNDGSRGEHVLHGRWKVRCRHQAMTQCDDDGPLYDTMLMRIEIPIFTNQLAGGFLQKTPLQGIC